MCSKLELCCAQFATAIVRDFKRKSTKEGVSYGSTKRSEVSLSQTN